MTRKLTLFAACAFEVALILFVAAWTALADVLPDVSPEEQYRFSLGKALANDLVTAEAAFDEFREVNKGHERFADATFWLGRVQFVQGKYEQAAMTFSEFNTNFPTDNRLVKTTMWIAESVSRFAPREQACEIYEISKYGFSSKIGAIEIRLLRNSFLAFSNWAEVPLFAINLSTSGHQSCRIL